MCVSFLFKRKRGVRQTQVLIWPLLVVCLIMEKLLSFNESEIHHQQMEHSVFVRIK